MITKEKNLIFIDAKNRHYTIDLNTCTAYSGKRELKGVRSIADFLTTGWGVSLSDCENNKLLHYILTNRCYFKSRDAESIKVFNLIERLDTHDYPIRNIHCSILFHNYKIVNDNFADFIKTYKEKTITLTEYIKTKEKEIITKNIECPQEWLDEGEMYREIVQIITQQDEIGLKTLKTMVYYHNNGLMKFFIEFLRIRRLLPIFKSFYDYIYYCKILNKKIYKGNSFIKEFLDTKTEYDNFIDAEKAKKLKENQNLNFAYENENYIVLVPTTPEEFKNEANQQQNCVYRLYLDEVLDNRTNIVFVRKKNNINASYITCEIDKKGRIVQFLLERNQQINKPEDILFLEEYQNYINSKIE